jgi:hypothetical protein
MEKARQSFGQTIAGIWRRLRRSKPQPPTDPYADRLVPVRRGPKGRGGAAVAEPEEESDSFFPPRQPL